jgi:UbiD family decarboxylase
VNKNLHFKDLQSQLRALEETGKLIRVRRPINKDTELHPLVRWQFRGLQEKDRRAFLFENVTDSRGARFKMSVAVCAIAGSQEIYNSGLGCRDGEEVNERWLNALNHPIPPRLVDTGPVHDVVHAGASLLEHGGLEELPVPISTPGFDNAPYFNSSIWVVKDPETGIQNMGIYRGQIKGKLKTGVKDDVHHDFARIWEKHNARGQPMEAAAVIGASPSIYYAATETMPYGFDEMDIAGGLDGEGVEVVRCKTIDMQVPAHAEIVLEGKIRTDILEPEGSFGESHGHCDPRFLTMVFEVTAITHRQNPVFLSIVSQVTPSESSKSKQKGYETECLRHLRDSCGFKGVLQVTLCEDLLNRNYGIVKMRKRNSYEPMDALYAFMAKRSSPKVIVAVDEDIDSQDPVAVNWAIVSRCQPHRDIRIVHPRPLPWGPLQYAADGVSYDRTDSALLIDATKKADLAPVALPAREYMERALQIWKELEFPTLEPRSPWFGYSLGAWSGVHAEEAELAVQGRYYETAEKLATQQVAVKPGIRLASMHRHPRT